MSEPRRTTIRLAGEVDIRSASQVQEQVTAALTTEHPDVLVLDLSAVTFLDSVGIGFLVALEHQTRDHDCSLRLRGLQRPVRRVLTATGLDDVLTIESD